MNPDISTPETASRRARAAAFREFRRASPSAEVSADDAARGRCCLYCGDYYMGCGPGIGPRPETPGFTADALAEYLPEFRRKPLNHLDRLAIVDANLRKIRDGERALYGDDIIALAKFAGIGVADVTSRDEIRRMRDGIAPTLCSECFASAGAIERLHFQESDIELRSDFAGWDGEP